MDTTRQGTLKEELHCFVCDTKINGRYYSLATCRTQTTRNRIIEKLGALVGDQYMVVISEDDVICRTCATSVNNLDRLEAEIYAVRSNVLKFLEKKYGLSEGELVNQKSTGLSQPPRVVPSEKPGDRRIDKKGFAQQGNFMARKRKAALAQMAELEEQENIHRKKNSGTPWMQCNTCKYTTSYDAFIQHHIVDEFSDNVPASLIINPTKGVDAGSKYQVAGKSQQRINPDGGHLSTVDENSRDSDNSETVEMIAAEINEYAVKNLNGSAQTSSKVQIKDEPETIKVQIISQGKQRKSIVGKDEHGVMIQLPNLSDISGTDEGVMITDEMEPALSVEEQMMKLNEVDPDTVYVQMVDVEKTANVGATTKQVMTVSDDGTVEMVEVLWDNDEHGGGDDHSHF